MARWWQSLVVILSLTAGPIWGQAVSPPTPETLAETRGDVRAAINRALARYPGDSACAEMLRTFHQTLLERESTVDEASTVLAALADGRGFLALPEYVTVRERLHSYIALLRQASEPDFPRRYLENVAALEAAIQQGAAAEAQEPYRWLGQREVAEKLRHRAGEQFARNNVVLRVSAVSGNRILPNPFTQSFRNTTSMEGSPATVTGTLVATSQLYAPPGGTRLDHAGINVNAAVSTNVAMSRERLSLGATGRTRARRSPAALR
jgi:hypothetical protein